MHGCTAVVSLRIVVSITSVYRCSTFILQVRLFLPDPVPLSAIFYLSECFHHIYHLETSFSLPCLSVLHSVCKFEDPILYLRCSALIPFMVNHKSTAHMSAVNNLWRHDMRSQHLSVARIHNGVSNMYLFFTTGNYFQSFCVTNHVVTTSIPSKMHVDRYRMMKQGIMLPNVSRWWNSAALTRQNSHVVTDRVSRPIFHCMTKYPM